MATSVLDPHELRGSELAGVAFVRDYVELFFDGPIVRCYAPPQVVADGRTTQVPEAGSRDALCALIGAEVLAVEVGDRGLSIDFAARGRVQLDFTAEWEGGREAAEFVPMVEGRLVPEQTLVW